MRIAHYILPSFLILLTACQGNSVKNTLGLGRSTPDEFMVLSRPPLSMPPDFNLRPPGDGVSEMPATPMQIPTESTSTSAPQSKGVQSLLDKAGADAADPNIRATIERENFVPKDEEEDERGFVTRMRDTLTPEKKDPLVDIDREEERLEKNTTEGKHASEGEVITKDTGKKGILNDMLGL